MPSINGAHDSRSHEYMNITQRYLDANSCPRLRTALSSKRAPLAILLPTIPTLLPQSLLPCLGLPPGKVCERMDVGDKEGACICMGLVAVVVVSTEFVRGNVAF